MSSQYIPMEHDTLGEYARQIYYLEEDNTFVNEYGMFVFNIHDYLTPNELLMFKRKKDYLIIDKAGTWIEFVYVEAKY